MLKKIDVEKSVVYNNITNKLDGLYLGQIGYFSDSLSFGIYETNQLYDIVTSSSFRYRTPTGEKFTYFIPAEKGDNDCVLTCAFSAYRCRLICIDVCLGVEWISLGTLFDKFEYKDTLGNWVPFGVEE